VFESRQKGQRFRKVKIEVFKTGLRAGAIMKKLIIVAILTSACNLAGAQDRGTFQYWENEYTARELLNDCNVRGAERCLFFIRSVAQASFWFDKCIPTGTSLTEIGDITQRFVKENPQYADNVATNVLLTAIHQRWKCR
jgi:hypothetical protein